MQEKLTYKHIVPGREFEETKEKLRH